MEAAAGSFGMGFSTIPGTVSEKHLFTSEVFIDGEGSNRCLN